MRTRQQIDKDLLEVRTQLKRAYAHMDLDAVASLVTKYDKLLDEILALRKVP